MASRGILHIVRNFNELDKSGVYDLAYTPEDGAASPGAGNHIRRFFGEQELTEFLKKHLNRDPGEVRKLIIELDRSGHARILNIALPDELRDLAA